MNIWKKPTANLIIKDSTTNFQPNPSMILKSPLYDMVWKNLIDKEASELL